MRVFFSAGEASGDAYAAALLREIRRLAPIEGGWSREYLAIGKKLARWFSWGQALDWNEDLRRFEHGLAISDVIKPLEEEFETLISESDFRGLSTLGDLAQFVGHRRPDLMGADVDWHPNWSFEGIGGSRLRASGANVVADSSKWGAISIVQALKKAPPVIAGVGRARRALARGQPGLFIPIDFGYVNIKLARYAKGLGWKVLYFIPPGSWRRDKQGKDLPQVTDEIVTPFPWSAEILRQMGASAHFFGHPLKQMIKGTPIPGPDGRRSIAILPGSRLHEISENLPAIATALADASGDWQGDNSALGSFERLTPGREAIQDKVEFAVASSVRPSEISNRWVALSGRMGDVFTENDPYGVLGRARAAIVCSGTATLEAALCRCPMVVMYRFGKMTELEIRLRGVRPKFISLPNILLDREVVPELIQRDATPEAVRACLDKLFVDSDERARQLAAFEELDGVLGPDVAITRTAELALRMLQPLTPHKRE